METVNTVVPTSSQSLFTLISTYLLPSEQWLVEQASALAARAHDGFRRQDGSPYLEHVTAVAHQLALWHAPTPVVAAGLLHGIGKEEYVAGRSLEEAAAVLDDDIARLAQNVARLNQMGTPYPLDYPNYTQERWHTSPLDCPR